jgi:hypothetical protein
MNGYLLLANAIVEQTAEDYTKALCETKGQIRFPKNEQKRIEIEKTINDCERFFTGNQITKYTSVDGRKLMVMLQQEAEQYNYDLKAIRKSRRKGNDEES